MKNFSKLAAVVAAAGATAVLAGCSADPAASLDSDLRQSKLNCESAAKALSLTPDSVQFSKTVVVGEKDITEDATEWTVRGLMSGQSFECTIDRATLDDKLPTARLI